MAPAHYTTLWLPLPSWRPARNIFESWTYSTSSSIASPQPALDSPVHSPHAQEAGKRCMSPVCSAPPRGAWPRPCSSLQTCCPHAPCAPLPSNRPWPVSLSGLALVPSAETLPANPGELQSPARSQASGPPSSQYTGCSQQTCALSAPTGSSGSWYHLGHSESRASPAQFLRTETLWNILCVSHTIQSQTSGSFCHLVPPESAYPHLPSGWH